MRKGCRVPGAPDRCVRGLLAAGLLAAVGVQLLLTAPASVAAQAPAVMAAQDPAVGERLAEQNGCLNCHTIDGGDSTGPTWQGLAGSEETLQDGSTVPVDDAYLLRAIQDPDAEIVEGFPGGVMAAAVPSGTLSDQEAEAIVAYIKSLGGGGAGTPAEPAPTGPDTPVAEPTRPDPPDIYYAGWGLLAFGGLIALVTLVAYLWYAPNFRRGRG